MKTHVLGVSLAVGAQWAVVGVTGVAVEVWHGHLERRVELGAREPHSAGEVVVGRVGGSRDGRLARIVGSLVTHGGGVGGVVHHPRRAQEDVVRRRRGNGGRLERRERRGAGAGGAERRQPIHGCLFGVAEFIPGTGLLPVFGSSRGGIPRPTVGNCSFARLSFLWRVAIG